MGDICSCYRAVEKRRYVYSVETGQPVDSVTDTVGCCIGTKELDKCTCGGNEAMCDFYPKKRREREKNSGCGQQSEIERLSAAYEAALTELRERAEMIGRLQKENEQLNIEIKAMRGAANSYKAENERLRKQLDAALCDMKHFCIDWWENDTRFPCDWCKYQLENGMCQWKINNLKNDGCYGRQFKWCGIRKEESNA